MKIEIKKMIQITEEVVFNDDYVWVLVARSRSNVHGGKPVFVAMFGESESAIKERDERGALNAMWDYSIERISVK